MLKTIEPFERDPLSEPMAAVLGHRAFDAAARDYVDNVIAWRRRLGLFNRVGTNLAFHVINYVVYLHFSAQAGTLPQGATFSRILDICEARGNCGGRALRTVLVVLQALGRLKSERAADDGRAQVFVPADSLLAEVREIYGYSLTVLDQLMPGSGYGNSMREDSAFVARHISRIGRAIIEDNVRITEHFPDLHDIINRAGGLPTSLSLAAAEMNGTAFPSPGSIARDFNVSISQVRAVINELAARNLIVRADDGRVVDASRLLAEHKALIAREIALHVKFGLNVEAQLEKVSR